MRALTILVAACTLVLPVLALGPAWAERATTAEMEQVCENWLKLAVHERGAWAGSVRPSIVGVQEITQDGILLALCYSIAPQGHVVVPVLKELPAVKSYSEKYDIDVTEPGYPELLRAVLYDRITRYVEAYGSMDAAQPLKGDVLLGRAHREEWDRLLASPDEHDLDRKGGESKAVQYGPLLTTSWHQARPYNQRCPWGNVKCPACSGVNDYPPTDPSLVGCVATATAQIMNYWEWPPHGEGEYYVHAWTGDNSCPGAPLTPPETLTVYLFDPYDWANMPDSCDAGCLPVERHAVAELCYEVGAVLDVDYGVCHSPAWTSKVAIELPARFAYVDSIVTEWRMDYPIHSFWSDMIKAEIEAGRPILYVIELKPSSTAHALVCDGWRDTQGPAEFHMNYGWGGPCTAWYRIDLLMAPSMSFISEYLLRNIKPPKRYFVRPDGGGPSPPYYSTIQAAVDAAPDGHTIGLENGTFSGPGNRDITFGSKAIKVRSLSGNPDSCIIDCQGTFGSPHRGFDFDSSTDSAAVVDGVTIINGHSGHANLGGAIRCEFGAPMITNCVFRDNLAGFGGGVGLNGCSARLTHCTFDADSAGFGGGFFAIAGSTADLLYCTFHDNRATGTRGGGGIGMWSNSTITATNSIIAFSVQGEAVGWDSTGSATFTCCDVDSNAGGDWVEALSGQLGVSGNIQQDPVLCHDYMPIRFPGDLTIHDRSPCSPRKSGCGYIGAWEVGCYFYVYPDTTKMAGGYPTILDAVNASSDGDVIELADGYFTGEDNRGISFEGKAITIRSASGNAEDCIIDCAGLGQAFIFNSGEGPGSVLQDLTIRNGSAAYGAAVECDSTSPTIIGCIFESNNSSVSGGAVSCWHGASPIIQSCTFVDNDAADMGGGLFCRFDCYPTVSSCTFWGNSDSGSGGAISCMNACSLTVHSSIIAFNDTRAIYCDGSDATFTCSDIYGNTGGDWEECITDQYEINGNISEDPFFCDAEGGDYSISINSPCAPSDTMYGCPLMGAWSIGCATAGVEEASTAMPAELDLAPSVPNPFNPMTEILYAIPGGTETSRVTLTVYNCLGQRVRTLVDGRVTPGVHSIVWDGRDHNGVSVASGVYFSHLRWKGEARTQRMVLLK